MNTVKVNKQELLKKLQANRAAHRDLFIKAQTGYRELVIQELDKSIADARAGRAIRTHIRLEAPQDHTSEYDNVIEMLRMSVDETIELEAHAFQCYVLDKWQWAAADLLTKTAYASAAR